MEDGVAFRESRKELQEERRGWGRDEGGPGKRRTGASQGSETPRDVHYRPGVHLKRL